MGILDLLSPLLGPIIDRVFPDPKEREAFQLKLAQLADQDAQREHDELMGQITTNTTEAANGSVFVAGWRPFIGWVGGVSLAYSFVIEPFASWTASVVFKYAGTFPVLNNDQLMTLIMGMLGFHGLRTYEKVKGVAADNITSTPTALPAPKKKILGIKWPF